MEVYHVLNHGVEKRDLFMDDKDRMRFVHDLYEFNDESPTNNLLHRIRSVQHSKGLRNPYSERTPRRKIVDLHGWCLMKNHYHLLLSARIDGGLSLFLRKLNVGYANYFNERYHRSGTLFKGRTKKILIERDAHFLYILHYIHLNPLDYLPGASTWRERDKSGIRDWKKAIEYLNGYRWSSYIDYAGSKNIPSIITTTLFKDVFGNYKNELAEYLKSAEVLLDVNKRFE